MYVSIWDNRIFRSINHVFLHSLAGGVSYTQMQLVFLKKINRLNIRDWQQVTQKDEKFKGFSDLKAYKEPCWLFSMFFMMM